MDVRHRGSSEPASPAAVCRRWLADPSLEIGRLPSAGFSGSQVLVVRRPGAAGGFVLKAFHAGTSRGHAGWVHGLVGHLRAAGIDEVPEVVRSLDGDTVVTDDAGTLWELCRLMPGMAVPHPDPRQAAAAGAALARLHLAAATLPGTWPRVSPSPGMLRRIEQARALRDTPWEARRAASRRAAVGGRGPHADFVGEVAERFDAAIDLFAAMAGGRFVDRVARLQAEPLAVQPVLRDVWCDHVLYSAPNSPDVTGIVDLHAAGVDTPATDIARLLGSWGVSASCARLSPVDRHPAAIEAYEKVRPLSSTERRLIGILHATTVVFALDNWFRWTLEDHRDFFSDPRVLERIDGLLQEFAAAVGSVVDPARGVD